MSKRLYDVLQDCKKEEEVKEQFVKFFHMKLNALKSIDHYTEEILYEFKLNKNFKNRRNIAIVIAQTMYYIRGLKFGKIPNPLPPTVCVVDKNETFFFVTKKFSKFYNSNIYDWDRCASMPDKLLIDDIEKYKEIDNIHIFDLVNEIEEKNFIDKRTYYAAHQLQLFSQVEKKSINEDNFFEVYKLWLKLFGEYVKNGRKQSEYFLADIEEGKSFVVDNQVGFNFEKENAKLKQIPQKDYQYFWNIFDKVTTKDILSIRQKSDRISEEYERKFTGEYYTPIEFAEKGLQYLEKIIGKEWWKSGEYRFWDMAAGTGNLEFTLPSSALPYCYLSTKLEDDVQYLKTIFPEATCFQYDYLNDDIGFLTGNIDFGFSKKMPQKLVDDLSNPSIKWVIFINPPWATSNEAGDKIDKKSKNNVSKTQIRELMKKEKLGAPSRELFTQFLYRISKEFANKSAYLCLYSTLKYLNSENDRKIRDTFFQYEFKKGFIFSIKHFTVRKEKQDFPVGFLIWDLSKNKKIKGQDIVCDVFNRDFEKYATKHIYNTDGNLPLTKWIDRERNTSIMPPFSSAIKIAYENKDKRDRVANGFICSLSNQGNDFQHQNKWCLLSGPQASAGAFSVTPRNFQKAMIIHTIKKIPSKVWTNNRDQFFAPIKELNEEFVNDCIVWSVFSDSNDTVSLSDVDYNGRIFQIHNNLYPYLLEEIKQWPCSLSSLSKQISLANENRFLANWFRDKKLSSEAQNVYNRAKELYKFFYLQVANTHWVKYKITKWDVGLWQIKQSLKEANLEKEFIKNLEETHNKLTQKLLPLIYEYGFIYKDIEEFEEY